MSNSNDSHGVKQTFEIANEKQVVGGASTQEDGKGFRFGRIFHGVPGFRPTDRSLEDLAKVMTAKDTRLDSRIPAGFTYLGQFIDHDMTFDGSPENPSDAVQLPDVFTADDIKQMRSPSLDLDSLYGTEDEASLLRPDGVRFRLGRTEFPPGAPSSVFPPPADKDFDGFDVPREASGANKGKAIIGDPRNDENLIVQQIHLLFLKFHNRIVETLKTISPTKSDPVLFAEARELTTRHYQFIVLTDFVRRIIDRTSFDSILDGKKLEKSQPISPNPLVFKITGPQIPPMPLEFSAAAYRLGHSMVRNNYSWNKIFLDGTPFGLFFNFTHKSGGIGRPASDPFASGFGPSRGLSRFPSNWIADWRRMFELEKVKGFQKFKRGANESGGEVPLNLAKAIDIELATELGRLPRGGKNLAALNMIRGSRNGLPSGQDVAAAMVQFGDSALKVLTPAEINSAIDEPFRPIVNEHEFAVKTPLWFYILIEAQIREKGETLGPVGSRIVAETFLALVRASRTSILNADLKKAGVLNVFSPEKDSPIRTPGGEPIATMAQLIAFVGDANPLGD